jgi:hypothetical protein
MRSRIAGPALLTIALIALVGCSGATGGSAAPSASAATSAGPSSGNAPATPSAAASSAAPSQAAASEPAASEPVPGYTFPSEAKDLEAVIPDTICGAKAQKLSMKGKDVFNPDNEAAAGIEAALNAIGKTTDDVSAAAGFSITADTGCSVTIIRIDGADEGQLRDLLKAEAVKEKQTFTETTLGGKTVYTDDPTKFGYTYIKGDGVIIFTAGTKQQAEELIAQLP